MTSSHFDNLEKFESGLWKIADNLRANSNLASNEYFIPWRIAAVSRSDFYDWLARTIKIDGIHKVARDTTFDDRYLRSAGIRLSYKTHVPAMKGLKEGVLLELGFDDVAPNEAKDISSWLYDRL